MDAEAQEDMEASEDATWVCDTIEQWRDSDKSRVGGIVNLWRNYNWADKLRRGDAHLVFTGGEPLLEKNVDAMVAFMDMLGGPFVEVETNGTLEPDDEVDARVSHYNVSLKLENSGMEEDRRLNPDAIEFFAREARNDRADFKFVVSDETQVDEVHEICHTHRIPTKNTYLMPAGASQEELSDTYDTVAEICKREGWRFSPRLHVNIWNQATSV